MRFWRRGLEASTSLPTRRAKARPAGTLAATGTQPIARMATYWAILLTEFFI